MKHPQLKLGYLVSSVVIVFIVWYLPIFSLLVRKTPLRDSYHSYQVQAINEAKAETEKRFLYPELAINAPLTYLSEANPFQASDWPKISAALRSGVGMVNSTTLPLEESPLLYIIGHSSDIAPHQYAFVFTPLGQAKKDDIFYLPLNGTSYSFHVVDHKLVDPNDEGAFKGLASSDPSIQRVALVTCWPVFTTRQRLVVIGERTR